MSNANANRVGQASYQLSQADGHRLPPALMIAQNAVNTPEVQAIIQQLAKYNLGVCMPHIHTADGRFEELPNGIVQVERKLCVSFVPAGENDHSVQVAWRWEGGPTAVACCCCREEC